MNYKINNDHLTTEQLKAVDQLQAQMQEVAQTHAARIETFFLSVCEDLGMKQHEMQCKFHWEVKPDNTRTLVHSASGAQIVYLGVLKTEIDKDKAIISQEALKLYTKEAIKHVKQND